MMMRAVLAVALVSVAAGGGARVAAMTGEQRMQPLASAPEELRAAAQRAFRAFGVCSNIKVVQSLDDEFGLDRQAMKDLSQWRFTPGTKDGQPVRVLVAVEMKFKLR